MESWSKTHQQEATRRSTVAGDRKTKDVRHGDGKSRATCVFVHHPVLVKLYLRRSTTANTLSINPLGANLVFAPPWI